jgi:ribosomal protein L11 methyltransferase
VVAIDVDPAAVDAATTNVARNEVDDRVHIGLGPLGDISPPFDVVLANITASVLVEVAEPAMSQLAPTGRLVVSGILVERAEEVRGAYDSVQWTDHVRALGWTAWAGVRSA